MVALRACAKVANIEIPFFYLLASQQPGAQAMNTKSFFSPSIPAAWRLVAAMVLPLSLVAGGAYAATAPAQKPMLTASTGAKPNLMLTLDNSGSMALPYHESYAVTSDTKSGKVTTKTCPAPLYGENGQPGGAPDSSNRCKSLKTSVAKTFTCVTKDDYNNYYNNSSTRSNSTITKYYKDTSCKTNGSKYDYKRLSGTYNLNTFNTGLAGVGVVSDTTWASTESAWHAMRSSDVNPIYYNPGFTYQARVQADGSPVAGDNLKFVSNQASVTFNYCANTNGNFYRSWRPGSTTTSGGCNYSPNFGSNKVPSLIEYTSTSASTPAFTYVACKSVVFSSSEETNCKTEDMVVEDITPVRTLPVNLPADHQRTDCGINATSCPVSAEIANILNWYRYYSFRADAVATSIGIALANDDYRDKLRIGYYPINYSASSNAYNPGEYNTYPNLWRGVRLSSLANNQQLYSWLYAYGSLPLGGTPLHNSLDKVAQYYNVTSVASENPWATNPAAREAGTSNPELACRRSFNILFSDGAWNSGTNTNSGVESDFPASRLANKPSTTGLALFQGYDKAGYPTTTAGRKLYTPYGNSKTGSLADLSAKYFWQDDLRTSVDNAVVARPGQPTTWQNMATYTIGYLIRPTGELPGATAGLTFEQIEDYKFDYLKNGAAATKPTWATSTSGDQNRIDDFIQAGFTGGGAGYSVVTPDDVRRTFDTILSDILNAAGKDAGVAVAGTSSTTSTLEGRLKYSVGYKTIDNSGNLEAIRLDASGNNADIEWSANDEMPTPQKRKLFVYDGMTDTRMKVDYNTKLSALPAALQAAINGDASLPTNENFIRYLLGDDTVATLTGGTFRQRVSALASSVNAPPLYVGARLNMGYGRDSSAVPGKTDYIGYFGSKIGIPGLLYAATNDGAVHIINAADTENSEVVKDAGNVVIPPGAEVGAFLLKETMPKLKNFANPSYSFEYMADGPLVEQDVWNGSAWKHMVFGAMGRGGKAVYAFNSPLNTGANKNRIPTEADYRWEVSRPNMGYISNNLEAGITTEGISVVLANNGHYAATGKAGLYVLDALTGAELKFIELPSTYNHGIGLGGITVVRNKARQIVAAYAGDAGGNLWRFKLDGNSSNWGVSNNQPLFTTPNAQSIYAAPAWTVHPGAPGNACQAASAEPGACGLMVVVGTGILLDDTHLSDTSTQSLYGVWDNIPLGGADVAYKDASFTMVQQTIDLASAKDGLGSGLGNTYYAVSKNAVDWTKNKGWYLDMGKLPNTAGERVIGDLFNLGTSVFATSVVISNTQTTADSCVASSGAVNVMYGLDALTGKLKKTFDQNGDGKADAYSVAFLPKGGFTRSSVLTQSSSTSNILDPNLTIGVGSPKEGNIDLLVREKATGDKGYNTGVDGTVTIFDGKDSTGWRRSWRQIINLPSTL